MHYKFLLIQFKNRDRQTSEGLDIKIKQALHKWEYWKGQEGYKTLCNIIWEMPVKTTVRRRYTPWPVQLNRLMIPRVDKGVV